MHVDAEAVDAAVEPEAQHVEHGRAHRGIAPVQVGLLRQEGVVVVLAGALVPASRPRPPKLLSQLLGGPPSGAGSRQRYQSRFGLSRDERLSRNHGCWSEVWLGTKSRMSFRPAPMRSRDQRVEIGQRAEERVDAAVIGDVVAEIGHRRGIDRREPDRVDAERHQIVEPARDARAGRRRRRRWCPGRSADRSDRRCRAATTPCHARTPRHVDRTARRSCSLPEMAGLDA